MPRTASSDFSLPNRSVANEHERHTYHRRHKKINKKGKNMWKGNRERRTGTKVQLLARPPHPKRSYSPEYKIRIRTVATPLYHSDEYEPCLESETKQN